MNLLQLAHRLPWPPIDGGNKGVLGFVEGYSRHPAVARLALVCMCRLEDAHWASDWRPERVEVVVEPMDASNSIPRLVANTLFSRRPFNMEKYRRASFAEKVRSAIAAVTPDVVHFDGLHTACYAPQVARLVPRALRVLRCHNAEYMILERLAESEPYGAKRKLIALQARRVRSYEAEMLDHFDLILAITETDAARFRALNPQCSERIIIVPAGTNLPAVLPSEPRKDGGAIRLIHIAAMDWLPNQGGLRWLRDEVLPLLDDAGLDYHLDVIGKNMLAEFTAMSGPRVKVHGFVEDLTPLMSAAHIAVVPLKVGSGMRVKILDYWAMGVPVVATRVAAEGLDGGDVPVVALADDACSFALAIQRLAANAAERRALRTAAFAKVSSAYGWPGLVDELVNRYAQMLVTRPERNASSGRHAA
jgi:glycosyltransferase involved in cell wall biosynthesis